MWVGGTAEPDATEAGPFTSDGGQDAFSEGLCATALSSLIGARRPESLVPVRAVASWSPSTHT